MSAQPLYVRGGRGRGRGHKNSNQQQAAPITGLNGRLQPAKMHSVGKMAQLAEQRFHDVSKKHQEAVKRHLETNNDIQSSSSEDEEESQDCGKILQNLQHLFSGSAGDGADLGRTSNFIQNSFKTESSVCLICIETVKKHEAVWSCRGCYCMFHIACIQKWVKDGVYQQTTLSEEHFPNREIPWLCPKCRYKYKQSDCPSRYMCFCGKVLDPKFDPWLVPHSCGQVCGRQLQPDCGHECLLLCHPGPCPPCPKTVQSKCHCGKSPPTARRCGLRDWSCGQPCGRRLTCGHHACQDPCHPGDCPACPKTSVQLCECGKKEAVRSCATPQWHCDQVCGRVLSCGQHTCEEVCHQGHCGPCPRSGNRRCPCGKSSYQLPCTEDVPCCGDTCGKMLECGLHQCSQRCHMGPCGLCRQMSTKRCRCGSKVKEVPCYKEFLCEVKCLKTRNCGKHQCKRKCCGGNCPNCEQHCGRTLSCRNHKCSNVCHTGQCYPCPLTVDIPCNCGTTILTVPCGRERHTKPPKCYELCNNPPDCHHKERVRHRCHFGHCPPCRLRCDRTLNCGHVCPSECHTAVRVKTTQNTVKNSPWDRHEEPKTELKNYDCPRCTVPLAVACLGKHEVSNIPCFNARPFSCNRQCGRRLICGNHTCQLECHVVEGATDDSMAGSNCVNCEAGCEKARPDGCSHVCSLPCHPGDCPPCRQMIRMRCHCQMTVQHIECHKWTMADEGGRHRMQSCPGKCPKLLSCGHQCPMSCHTGNCPDGSHCKKKTTQKCACKRRKQEVICCDVQKGRRQVECDDTCRELLKQRKEQEKAAEEERLEQEKQRQQVELAQFERKMQGRKRKPRKRQEYVEEVSWLDRYKKVLVVGSATIVVLAWFITFIL